MYFMRSQLIVFLEIAMINGLTAYNHVESLFFLGGGNFQVFRPLVLPTVQYAGDHPEAASSEATAARAPGHGIGCVGTSERGR